MKNCIGVIGAGHMATIHYRGFEATKVRVKTIADMNLDLATKGAEKFGAKATANWKEVIDDPEINAVAVFTNSGWHYEPVKAALEAGKHIISEKTLTLNPEESLDLARLAAKKNLILYTSYMKRFFPAVQKAKQLMSKIGHVMSVYARTYQGVDGWDFHTGEVMSYFKPDAKGVTPIVAKSGGGILVCGGSHIFDLLHYLVGNPKSVFATSFFRPKHDADFMTHALMELPEGGVIHFEGNWHPLKKIGYEGTGFEEEIEISGVGGRLIVQLPTWDQPLRTPASLRFYDNSTEAWTEFKFDRVDPFVIAETFFMSQIEKGEQGEHDKYQGYRTDLLLALAAKSAREGKKIEVKYES